MRVEKRTVAMKVFYGFGWFSLFLVVCMVGFLVWSDIVFYMDYVAFKKKPLPKPTEIVAFIPENAEIYDASQVSPGTFKIHKSLEEFQEMADREKSLVTYSGEEGAVIRYWLPRGDGVFYFSYSVLSPDWPYHAAIGSMDFSRIKASEPIVTFYSQRANWKYLDWRDVAWNSDGVSAINAFGALLSLVGLVLMCVFFQISIPAYWRDRGF